MKSISGMMNLRAVMLAFLALERSLSDQSGRQKFPGLVIDITLQFDTEHAQALGIDSGGAVYFYRANPLRLTAAQRQ